MKSQDKLDQKLRDNTTIPMGLEWDDVSGGIYEKMPSKKKSKKGILWIFFSLGLFVSVFYLMFEDTSQNPVSTLSSEDEAATTVATEMAKESEEISITAAHESENTRQKDAAVANTSTEGINNSKTTIAEKLKPISNFKDNLVLDKTTTVNSNDDNTSSTYNTYSEQLSSVAQVSSKNDKNISQAIVVADIQTQKANVLGVDARKIELEHEFASTFDDKTNTASKSSPKWSIALVGSLVAWDQAYDSNPVLSKQSAEESTLLGYHVGIEGSYLINNRWSIFSGVDRSRLYSKYEGTFDSEIEVQYSNVVVLTEINPLHSQPTHHHGDTTALRPASTFVSYHNIIDRWSVPVGLRFHTTSDKLQFMAGLGLQVGLYKTGEGVSAREDQLLIYGDEQQIIERGVDLAIRPEIGIQYLITDRIYAGLSINYQQHLVNWSSESSLMLRPKIFRSSLSLGYRW